MQDILKRLGMHCVNMPFVFLLLRAASPHQRPFRYLPASSGLTGHQVCARWPTPQPTDIRAPAPCLHPPNISSPALYAPVFTSIKPSTEWK